MLEKEYQRIDWIDAAKGIGIILVLIGHCNIPDVNQYIYLFHMPLFYIISGFLWNVDKNRALPFNSFAKKKFKSYIVPYFKIATICFFIFGVIGDLIRIGNGPEYYIKLIKYIFGIMIYSRGTTEWLPDCSPIWFLTTLYFAELMLYWIMKQRRPLLYVLLAGIIGYICFLIGKFFPWNIDNAFSSIPFLYVGILIRHYWEAISELKYLPFLIIGSTITFCYGILGGDFDGNNIKYIYITGFEAILIVTSILSIVYRIKSICGGGYLSFLGSNTLMLFGYNYAINACLHFIIPSVDHTWGMACIVILIGTMSVVIMNKVSIVKKVII